MPRILKLTFASLTFVAISLIAALPAQADTINFESVPGLTPFPSLSGVVPVSARFSNQLASQGVLFNSVSGVVSANLKFDKLLLCQHPAQCQMSCGRRSNH